MTHRAKSDPTPLLIFLGLAAVVCVIVFYLPPAPEPAPQPEPSPIEYVPAPPVLPQPTPMPLSDADLLAELQRRSGETPASSETRVLLLEAIQRGLLTETKAQAESESGDNYGGRRRRR